MLHTNIPSELLEQLQVETAQILGCDVGKIPPDVTTEDASKILGVAVGTMNIWRTTGRYNLQYLKIGRRVFYRVADLIGWKARRLRQHT